MSNIAPVQPLALGLLQPEPEPEPGFRFHPTDQELVTYYLIRKVHGHHDFIPEVHVYKHEPWELPGKSFSPSTHDTGAKEEWYLFAVRGRKYPNGLRMERATVAGFWKSTGKDRPVMHNDAVVGMKKTLVFHTGRAPTGIRTDWVMHEYRLHGQRNHHIQDTYALCRVFKKNMMAPSTDVSGDAYTDEDLMQSVPRGVNTHKALMEHVFDGADSDKYPMQSVLGGVGTDNNPIWVESESDVTYTGKDPVQVESESDGAGMDKDLMRSVLSGVGTDKDPIQVESESDGADADMDLMRSVLGGIVTDNDLMQPESELNGVDANKGEKQFHADGGHTNKGGDTNKDKEGTQPTTGGGGADEDNSDNTWYTNALLKEDNSWTQFTSNDDWYTRVDVDKDDSLMQFIFGDVMLLSAD